MATEPSFNAGGYPTDETVEAIKDWDHGDFVGLMEFIRKAWYYPNYFQQDGRRYKLSTGGWSGNEEIIEALSENFVFWSMCWESSRRGGHHEFKLPIQVTAPEVPVDNTVPQRRGEEANHDHEKP